MLYYIIYYISIYYIIYYIYLYYIIYYIYILYITCGIFFLIFCHKAERWFSPPRAAQRWAPPRSDLGSHHLRTSLEHCPLRPNMNSLKERIIFIQTLSKLHHCPFQEGLAKRELGVHWKYMDLTEDFKFPDVLLSDAQTTVSVCNFPPH